MIAKNIVLAKDKESNISRRPSAQGLMLTNGSVSSHSPPTITGHNGTMVIARSPSGLTRGNSGLTRGNSNSGLTRGNSNSAMNYSATDNSAASGGYEYDPNALGIVTKRAWDEKLDLAYEEEKPKNNRMKRPGAAVGGNVIIKVGGDNPTGGGPPITRQTSKSGNFGGSGGCGGGGGVSPGPLSRQGSAKLMKTPSSRKRTNSST